MYDWIFFINAGMSESMNVMVGSSFGRKYELSIKSGVTVTMTAGMLVMTNPKLFSIIGLVVS